jgi:RecQ-mediated genome instability protein 1
LQTLKKTDNENSEVTAERTQFTQVLNQNDTSKRMLKLELNDGFSTINAIEHEYCGNKLKETNLRPGTKLSLIGPLHVRRGMILLYPRNIEVLGGYVEEMESEAGLEHRLESVLNPGKN